MMSIMIVSINTCEGTVGDERDTRFGNQGRVFRYRRNTDQFQKPYHAGIDAACIACPAREGNPCLCGHRPFENDDAETRNSPETGINKNGGYASQKKLIISTYRIIRV